METQQDMFLWGLKIADSLTMTLVSKMSVIALGVAAICFICNLAYNYLSHGASKLLTSDEDKFPDLMEIARCVTLLFCLTLYSPIAKTVVGTLEVINKATAMDSGEDQRLGEYLRRAADEQSGMLIDFQGAALRSGVASGGDPSGAMQKELDNRGRDDKASGVTATLKGLVQVMNPLNAICASIHAAAVFLIGVIATVVQGISVVIVKLLVILGPFTFAFSILPVFEKQISKWFGTLCSTGMVFTVVNILNRIMEHTWGAIYDPSSFNAVDEATKTIQYLAMDLVMIVAYCTCFWLAGIIVGHGDAGRIISKTIGIMTAAATMAATGGASAGAATNVGAAASLGKSVLSDE